MELGPGRDDRKDNNPSGMTKHFEQHFRQEGQPGLVPQPVCSARVTISLPLGQGSSRATQHGGGLITQKSNKISMTHYKTVTTMTILVHHH